MSPPGSLQVQDENPIFHSPWTALIPMLTGALSAFGSFVVIRELWGEFSTGQRRIINRDNHRNKNANHPPPPRTTTTITSSSVSSGTNRMRSPIVRCLVALSSLDLFVSLAIALSTVPSPRQNTHIPFAIGNFTTCEAQGFFLQLNNVASPLLTTLLTYFYMVILKYQWTDARIQRAELLAHAAIALIAMICAIFPIPMQLYNNPYHFCWISSFPQGCERFHEDVPCERGANFTFYLAVFTVLPIWPCLLAVAVMMCLIYHKVRSVEAVAARKPWGETTENYNNHNKHTNHSNSNNNDISNMASSEFVTRQEEKTNIATNEEDEEDEKEEYHDDEEEEDSSRIDNDDVITISGNPRNAPGVIRNSQQQSSALTVSNAEQISNKTTSSQQQRLHHEQQQDSGHSNDVRTTTTATTSATIIVNRRRSRAVARQALCFVLAFVVTHILRLVSVLWFAVAQETNPVLFVLAFDVMLPLQGWWNALVLLKTRQDLLHTPEGLFLKKCLSWSTYQEIGAGFWQWLSCPTLLVACCDASGRCRRRRTAAVASSSGSSSSSAAGMVAPSNEAEKASKDRTRTRDQQLHDNPKRQNNDAEKNQRHRPKIAASTSSYGVPSSLASLLAGKNKKRHSSGDLGSSGGISAADRQFLHDLGANSIDLYASSCVGHNESQVERNNNTLHLHSVGYYVEDGYTNRNNGRVVALYSETNSIRDSEGQSHAEVANHVSRQGPSTQNDAEHHGRVFPLEKEHADSPTAKGASFSKRDASRAEAIAGLETGLAVNSDSGRSCLSGNISTSADKNMESLEESRYSKPLYRDDGSNVTESSLNGETAGPRSTILPSPLYNDSDDEDEDAT